MSATSNGLPRPDSAASPAGRHTTMSTSGLASTRDSASASSAGSTATATLRRRAGSIRVSKPGEARRVIPTIEDAPAIEDASARAHVLIVEDHELLAQSLSFALRAEGLATDIVMSVDPEEIIGAQRLHASSVVLLDLDLGAFGSSIGLIEPLREGGARVVMLTGATDRLRLAECVEAGALGIIPKSARFEELVDGVRRAAGGHALLSASERAALIDALRQARAAERASQAPFQRLTARESEVLQALIDGRQAEAIAEEAFVSVATVRSQIRSVLMKLGVNSQLAAVALARRAAWGPD